MRKQYRHIVQEFGVAGFLCFYAFSPEKLLSFTNALCKGRKAHQSGTGKPSKNPDQTGYCKS